jgi:protein TonB
MRAHAKLAAWIALGLLAPLQAKAGPEAAVPVAAAVPSGERVVELDLAPRERSVAERIAEVRRKVQAAASYPPIARKRGVQGEALVSFEIASNGRPRAVLTLQSSGSGLLDRAALAAVEQAAPLPWIYGRVAVPVRFTLRDPD